MNDTSLLELQMFCERNHLSIAEAMLARESSMSGQSEQEICEGMKQHIVQIKKAMDEDSMHHHQQLASSGISGGDAYKLERYVEKGQPLTGSIVGDAMRYAFAAAVRNVQIGMTGAMPLVGAAEILYGCLFALHEHQKFTFEHLVMGLLTANAIGNVISNRAASGTTGGSQAETRAAIAMAATAIVEIKQGTPRQVINASALALQSMRGLAGDPIAGQEEVPCSKRNVFASSIAFTAADLALAGIESQVPCDDVIDGMDRIGKEQHA